MPDYNPYSPPYHDPSPPPRSGGSGEPPDERIVEAMERTGPWVRFLAVLGFVLVGLMVLVGLVLVAGAIAETKGSKGAENSVLMVLMAALYAVMGGLYLWPSVLLNRFASAIGRLRSGGSEAMLAAAEAQRGFWKFAGLAVIVMIGLWVVFMAAAIAIPAGMAAVGN